jgi:hypothetical protein
MTDPVLVEIIHLCLALEEKAAKTYSLFAQWSEKEDLKTFWRNMAQDEKDHIKYWVNVIMLAASESLPQIFDNPAEVLRELKKLAKSMDAMLADNRPMDSVNGYFLCANQMEFSMLHPSFAILFHFIKGPKGAKSPETDYDVHLKKFATAFRKFGTPSTEMELVNMLVQGLWRENRRLAGHVREIHSLRRLVPICSSCKKIRDDKGYWQQLEKYFQTHADVEFTHGYCPDCEEKIMKQLKDRK